MLKNIKSTKLDTIEGIDKINSLQKQVYEYDDYCKIINYYYIEDNFRNLSGKILTIIDASISEERQNKCVKDLIKAEFSKRIIEIQHFYNEGKEKGHWGHSVQFDKEGTLNN